MSDGPLDKHVIYNFYPWFDVFACDSRHNATQPTPPRLTKNAFTLRASTLCGEPLQQHGLNGPVHGNKSYLNMVSNTINIWHNKPYD